MRINKGRNMQFPKESRFRKMMARIQIQILLLVTAKAFRNKSKCILFEKDPLKEYAEFTKECMKQSVNRKDVYREAYKLGRRIRRIVGIRKPEQLKNVVFWLYKNIGITMTGTIPGEVSSEMPEKIPTKINGELLVSDCYFSNFYSPKECSCMSAMDAGIITGICGEGTIKFTERITEGCKQCKISYCERI